MAKEIHEQPEAVGHTLARHVEMAALKLKPFAWPADPKQLKRLTIVGCSTAYISSDERSCRSRSVSPRPRLSPASAQRWRSG
jgi:hypothetical protein